MKEITKYTVETSTGFWECFTEFESEAIESFYKSDSIKYDGQEIKSELIYPGIATKSDILSDKSLYFLDSIRKELTYFDKNVFGLMGADKIIQCLEWVINDFEDDEGLTIFYYFCFEERRERKIKELIEYVSSTGCP